MDLMTSAPALVGPQPKFHGIIIRRMDKNENIKTAPETMCFNDDEVLVKLYKMETLWMGASFFFLLECCTFEIGAESVITHFNSMNA